MQEEEKQGCCKIYFIDVGQGDCILIQLPDGKNMIIDSGNNNKDVRDSIGKTLSSLNVSTIDYLLATHQDADHIGSMPYIFNTCDVLKVFRPYVLSTNQKATNFDELFNAGLKSKKGYSDTATYYNFLNSVLQEGSEWEFFTKDSEIRGELSFGDTTSEYLFDFLTPIKDVTTSAYSDANDYSPIVLFSYLGVDILFTGDAEKEVLSEYMSTYSDTYDIDVLKVGHHGSYTSTTDEYVKAIRPEYAIIQVGEGNTYRHPRQETLDIFFNNDVLVYRNDLNGQIVLTITSSGEFFIEAEKVSDYQSILNGL